MAQKLSFTANFLLLLQQFSLVGYEQSLATFVSCVASSVLQS